MRGKVLPEEVITLATLKKISLVVVAFYFFKIFIIQKRLPLTLARFERTSYQYSPNSSLCVRHSYPFR